MRCIYFNNQILSLIFQIYSGQIRSSDVEDAPRPALASQVCRALRDLHVPQERAAETREAPARDRHRPVPSVGLLPSVVRADQTDQRSKRRGQTSHFRNGNQHDSRWPATRGRESVGNGRTSHAHAQQRRLSSGSRGETFGRLRQL